MKCVKQLKAQVGKAGLDPTLASHYQKQCWLSVYVTKQAGKEGSHPEQWRDKRRTRCKGGLDVLRMPWDSLPVRERETRHLCLQTSTAADGETSAANPAGGSRHALTSLADQPVMVTSGCPRWLGGRTAKQSGRSFPALRSYSHSLSHLSVGLRRANTHCIFCLEMQSLCFQNTSLAHWRVTPVSISHLLNWCELPSSRVTFKGSRCR